mmetsp:Transcript_42350/g.99631  ORF Transcript_42350/g.99631 Transcript_42350/m.99631 type:complete len:157 (-) Transcript_42350:387-857(-)
MTAHLRRLRPGGRLRSLTACAAPCPARAGQFRPVTLQEFTMNHAFITDEQRIVLLANGRESLENPDFDPAPVVKLFTPDAGATWLLTEIDPDDHDHAFGLCDLGLGMPEIGWVSLSELATVRGRLGLPVERDLHFRAEKRLSAYARDARLAGRVVV